MRGAYYPVLDHGFVSLVDSMGDDRAIEDAARVSYGPSAKASNDTRGLLRYLMRHRHTSPFEMVELKFHCRMPIFVARQWIRHRTASVNEVSGRYAVLPVDCYTPTEERMQTQSASSKQGSSGAAVDRALYMGAVSVWETLRASGRSTYEWLCEAGVARELARIDLPLSTYTEWLWKIDLHNLFHFLALRLDEHPQWEIREYARVMAALVREVAPIAFEAWVDYELCAVRFGALEMRAIRALIYHAEESDTIWGNQFGPSMRREEFIDSGATPREWRELVEKLRYSEPPTFELPEAMKGPHE